MTLNGLFQYAFFRSLLQKKQMQTHTISNENVDESRMVLISKSIRYVRIFAGVPRTGAPNDSGVLENDILSHFVTIGLRSPSPAFQ